MNISTPSTANAPQRLAQYLKEFVGLRTTTVRDVAKYEVVLWFGDMVQGKDCFSPAWAVTSETGLPWLEVKKQQYDNAPKVPESLLPWIDAGGLTNAKGTMPELKKSIFQSGNAVDTVADESELSEVNDQSEDETSESKKSEQLIEIHLKDHPEIQETYDNYRKLWQAWADEHTRRQKIQDLYAKLFGLHTQLRKQGELQELVLGLGLLDWRAPLGGHIRRHLITAQVELIFEPDKGLIRLVPAGDGARLRIEDDMLEAELRPARSQYQAVQQQLDDIGDEIWDEPIMHGALKHWAGALNADSVWSGDLRTHASDPNKPVVSFAPALILRKRTQSGMVRIYDSMIDQLGDETVDIPEGWLGLIDDLDDIETAGRTENGEPLSAFSELEHKEVYFPLPANKEQRRIVEAIDRQRGVLVQGPPGTGKSHTIANLICHLLATGQRVLITAETSRALMVLKDKLPKEIQPLCVSLLGQGGDAFAELNMAVQGITTRQASYTPGAYEPRIAEIDTEIDQARRNLAAIDNEIRSLREEETRPHQIAGGAYAGTASEIAKRVALERTDYEWLKLPYEAPVQSPCTSEEMIEWLDICHRYSSADILDAQLKLPEKQALVEPQKFSMLVSSESTVKDEFKKLDAARSHPAYSSLYALVAEERIKLGKKLRQLDEQRLSVLRSSNDWYLSALRDLLSGKRARWDALYLRHQELITEANELSAKVGNSVVSFPENCNRLKLRSDAQIASKFLSEGGSWKRMGMFTPSVLKDKTYLKDDVLVDGLNATSHEQLELVSDEISFALLMEELISVWADVGVSISISNRRLQLAELQEQQESLKLCCAYADACNEISQALNAYALPVPKPDWLGDDISRWLELLEVADQEDAYNSARDAVNDCGAVLNSISNLHDAHPLVRKIATAFEQRNINDYSKFYAELIELEGVRRAQAFKLDIEARLRPYIADTLETAKCGEAEVWRERLASWVNAWSWAIADNWFSKRSDISYQQELFEKRHDIDLKIGQLIAETAGLRAWTHFFKRLSSRESAALKSWREAVKAMGKGTGKSAKMSRLKEEARQYMDQCRDAIPIWVMPRYLVAEMMHPAPGRYDIVIVDEASQLGIESLFLFYVAKKSKRPAITPC